MSLSRFLNSLENIISKKCVVSVSKTGTIYKDYPTPPYQTDMFLIRDKRKGTQYEIYAININGVYKIVEITKIEGNKIVSSINKDRIYKTLIKEVEVLLSLEQLH